MHIVHVCRQTARRKDRDVHTGVQTYVGVQQVSAAALPSFSRYGQTLYSRLCDWHFYQLQCYAYFPFCIISFFQFGLLTWKLTTLFFLFSPLAFLSNEFASERQTSRREMKGEGERDRVRAIRGQMEWMKKNQQSHVRLVKINSFSLHSLRLFLFLIWRAQGAFSKCFLGDA